MQVVLKTITPDVAQVWLDMNTNNRPLSKRTVKKLSDAMKRGEWKVNAETIKVNGTRLVDGQHRLSAVVQSGVTIQSYVALDVPCDVFDTVDAGKTRSAVDVFNINGEVDPHLLVPAVRVVHRLLVGGDRGKFYTLTNTQMASLLEEYSELRESLAFIRQHVPARRSIFPPSLGAALHYLMSGHSPKSCATLANEFWVGVLTGADISAGDPRHTLREKLIQSGGIAQGRYSWDARELYLGLSIKAWNLWISGKQCKRLTFGRSEKIPTIK